MPLRADGGARRDALEAIAVEAADTGEGVVGVPRDGEVRDLGPATSTRPPAMSPAPTPVPTVT